MERTRNWWDVAFVAGLFVFATALRLRFNLALHKPSDFIFSDMWVYEHRAGHLFDRDPYAWDTFTPNGYPAFLALVYRVVGRDFAVVAALQAVMGGAIPVLTYALARKITPSRLVAQLAGLVMALYVPLILYGGLLMAEVPFSMLLLVITLLVLRAAADGERRWWLWAGATGLVLSMAVLVRPNALVIVPGIALYFWTVLGRNTKAAGRRTAVLLAAALPLLLWCVVHNSRIAGHPVGLSTNGGLNFFLAQSEYRGAHFLEGEKHHEIVPIPNSVRYGAMYDSPVPLYDEGHFYRLAARHIAAHPTQLFASLENVKWGLGLGGLEYWPEWPPMRGMLITFSRSVFWLVLLPAGLYFAAFVLLRRHRKVEEAPRFLVLLTAFSVVPVLYLFLGDPRIRVPFDPLFVVLALDGITRGRAGLAWLRERVT